MDNERSIVMLRSDRILPAVFFAFLAFAYYQAENIVGKEKGLLGADFFPKMLIIVMAVLLVAIILEDLKKEKKEASQGKFRQGVTLSEGLKCYLKVILVFVISSVYIVLLEHLGYILDTILYLVSLTLVLKSNWKEKLPLTIGLMVSFTLVMYFIFTNLLHFSLPSFQLF
jgi:putative tricarboxylic transport membrane protein